MRIYNQALNLNFYNEEMPTFSILERGATYIPVARYTNLDTNDSTLYFFISDDMTLESFVYNLQRLYGNNVVYQNGHVEFLDWSCFSHVYNHLDEVKLQSKSRDIYGYYFPNDTTLKIGAYTTFDNNDRERGYQMRLVTSLEHDIIEATTFKVEYTKFQQSEIRPVLNVEVCHNMPVMYLFGARLSTCLGLNLDFLCITRSVDSVHELRRAIANKYQLGDPSTYQISFTSLQLSYCDYEIYSDLANLMRIDKYAPIVDFGTFTVQLRNLRNVNPVYAQANPDIPQLTQSHKLMPVYVF